MSIKRRIKDLENYQAEPVAAQLSPPEPEPMTNQERVRRISRLMEWQEAGELDQDGQERLGAVMAILEKGRARRDAAEVLTNG